jgi:asparagine synthase (glutamine-hydrolysing)
LFWGYPGWKTSWKLERWNRLPVPNAAKRLGLGLLTVSGRGEGFWYEWLRRGIEGQPVFWGGAEAFAEAHKRKLLSQRLRRRFSGYSSWEVLLPYRRRFEQQSWDRRPVQWMTYLDLNFRLPELLLMRVDKMSMGASLEARVPFLDHELVQLAMSIPEEVKTRHGVLKTVLKRAVRGTIPDSVIDREKQGFGVPVQEWMADRLGPAMTPTIEEFCDQTDMLDRQEARRVVDAQDPRGWYLFNLALWWKAYFR